MALAWRGTAAEKAESLVAEHISFSVSRAKQRGPDKHGTLSKQLCQIKQDYSAVYTEFMQVLISTKILVFNIWHSTNSWLC